MEGLDLGFAYLPTFEAQDYDKINAITSIENTASQKLLEKLGFQLHGTTQLPHETEELLLYSMEKK
ncbi:GNAT family N-acetyltransferase [Weeksellaceae bacterium KMM 9713]|uniref:GNAT family N-acetyltransferase n=1 Tax=Profundicola chukchiensis TaxID=2961959 RepID=A0A9X4MWW5_9FLAO|nr:GNAT family protein [Profundicola chukchiensis]MDG4946386.1 GNAT family N-acetyltransferase [Profundicola chukchiensis]MDG4950924.1 GNAT family N-acetyltransferase [Profundicola chukchiensis]